MSDRVIAGLSAAGGGALLAFLLFVPFVAQQYRRHGRFGVRRAAIGLAFLVHSLALGTYTLLPLPRTYPGFCEQEGAAGVQLVPFHFVQDIIDESSGYGAGALLGNPAVQQVLFNVALFVPLGMFVRHLFRRGPAATIAIGFGTSLLIEVTQLTGVWFLYPCAYRLGDVDDLLANTSGAALGLLFAPVLGWLGHRTAPLGEPREVRPTRRLLGALCDLTAVGLTSSAFSFIASALVAAIGGRFNGMPAPLGFVISTLLPVLLILVVPAMFGSGASLGQRVVLLKPVRADGTRPSRLALVARSILGVGIVFLVPGLFRGTVLMPLLAIYVVVSVLALRFTAGYRGLSGKLTRLYIADARERDGDEPSASDESTTQTQVASNRQISGAGGPAAG